MGIRKIGKPAIFLDRDGVLNALVLNRATGRMESPLTPDEFRLLDGVPEALLRLQSAGYPLILVSNQPNYALGKSTLQALGSIHLRLAGELRAAGVRFRRVCYCLHHPRGATPGYAGRCVCRKPSPWFLLQARDDFGLRLRDSWMIGDQSTDIECRPGRRSAHDPRRLRYQYEGGGGAQFGSGCGADYRAGNLRDAAEIILGRGCG